jgi:flagellar hook-associated protein 1
MGLSQALSAALAGVQATQKSLSVIAGNVANANTPGYVDESVTQVATANNGQAGSGVDVVGINRNLDGLLQSQLWTETSGGGYADTTANLYQQLQQLYGTPGSSTSLDAVYNNFTSALQALAANPGASTQQSAVIGAAQGLAQDLNGMTGAIQQLRTQAEQGIATDVQSANTDLQQIAQINVQLQGSPANDATAATLEDQRDAAITSLAQLMNVRVVQGSNNQVSVFTGTGQQLVTGAQASQLNFDNTGTLSATAQWSADPSQDLAGTITLVSPGGNTTDLIAGNAIQSGELAAYIQMRDTILPQAQSQLDEFSNQMAQALSNQTISGTAVAAGAQSGYSIDTSALSPGNSISVSYTDSSNNQHTVTIVALGAGAALPLQSSTASPNDQTIGVDFSGGMAAVVAQLQTALGPSLDFSNPSGSVLQVLNAAGSSNVVNSMSATATTTSLAGGTVQLPLFTDGNVPITGAINAGGTQTTGLAGRITVNPALVAAPSALVVYSPTTSSGDPTRPDFILDQLTNASLTFSPSAGIGSAANPYSGTLTDYLSQVVSVQSQAANTATNQQQGQDTVLSALQQRLNDQSGVNIDTEMSNLITLQNAYSANARVMTTIDQLISTLLQVVQ